MGCSRLRYAARGASSQTLPRPGLSYLQPEDAGELGHVVGHRSGWRGRWRVLKELVKPAVAA